MLIEGEAMIETRDYPWRLFLGTCRRILGVGAWDPWLGESWCGFTTFSSLSRTARYWNCGFPEEHELLEHEIMDGGLWRNATQYSDLAHVVIPAQFYWDRIGSSGYEWGRKGQDIGLLSMELDRLSIPYRKTEIILEVKLY